MENCRGEPVFDLSASKLLLRAADVEAGNYFTALSMPESSSIASIGGGSP
jgi:hypothetical protein